MTDQTPQTEALECVQLIRDGIEAFRLTREYVGEDALPPIEGWSWFDWCQKAEAWLLTDHENVGAAQARAEGLDVEVLALLTDAERFLALRPSGHTGSMDDRIPWFTHSGISHGEDRPDCVVCQWLARYRAILAARMDEG